MGNRNALRVLLRTLQGTIACLILGAAQAQTLIQVPQDYATIQDAIVASVNGDTVLVAPGTYFENINFLGKAITVKSQSGPDVTIIDGSSASSVVTFFSAESASSVLTGFTLQNGKDSLYSLGGGILINSASPTIKWNIITKNRACSGGAGIASYFGSPLIQENVITANTQSGCSGGTGGGGILVQGNSTAQIVGNVISGNSWTSAGGGGISLYGAGTPLIRGNIISGNSASNGGGVWMANDSNASIVQNVIARNSAYSGGGVYWLIPAPGPKLVNNTIVDNDSAQSSGIYADGYDGAAQLVDNIIVAKLGQTALYCGNFNDLNPPVIRFNNVYAPSGTAYGGYCPNATGTVGNISVDPLFAAQALRNYHLQNTSPAIDAGTNTAPGLPATDIEGNARIIDGDGNTVATVDLGAYEFTSSPPLVTMTPAAHDFGTLLVGTTPVSRTVTLSNAGTGALSVSLSAVASSDASLFATASGGPNPCGALAPTLSAGESCTLVITFTPGTTGIKTGELIVMSDAVGSPSIVALDASVVPPDSTVDPFGFTAQSNVTPGTLVVSNAITVSGINVPVAISVAGGDYSINGGAYTTAAGTVSNGQTVTLRFTSPPSHSTIATATLTIDGVSAGFSVTTSAGPAPIYSQTSLDFGYVIAGRTSSAQTVTVSSIGALGLNIGTVSVTGTGFAKAADTCTGAAVAPATACSMSFTFTPAGLGAVSGSVSVPSNAADSPHTIGLSGTGIASAVRIDFNGDGKSDILWRNEGGGGTGENYLYPMDGTTILGSEGYVRTVADLNWKVAGVGDFDGDNRVDILWRNSATGENYIYLMDGLSIKPSEGYIRTVVDQNWQVAGVGDFDGDGKDDILWRNAASGQTYIYPMDGLMIRPTEGYLRTVADTTWQIVGVGDFDGDNNADILWRNLVSGQNYLYPMVGLTIKPTEGYLRTVADLNWQVAGIGDYNGDEKSDILWRNATTGENYLYPMDGKTILGTEGYLRTVPDQSWQVKGTGDYDGDGRADILWRNTVTGENYLYPMDGTTIKPTEGYLRTVLDQDWQVQNPK